MIALALIRLRGFILHIARCFSTIRKWQLVEMRLLEGNVSRTHSGWPRQPITWWGEGV